MPTPQIKRVEDDALAGFISLVPENPNNVTDVVDVLPTIPNQDGHAVRILAKAGEPFRFFGERDFDSLSGARVSVQSLRGNIVGKEIEITTKDNTVFERLMCLRVDETRRPHEVLTLVGGIGTPAGLWGTQPGAATRALAYVTITVIHLGPIVTPP